MLCDDATVKAFPATGTAVGVDAGITSLVALSTGEKITNPKFEKKDRAKLARAQRELSRKQKDSKNRDRARGRVARTHARIVDRRRDFLHKLSTRLVRENQTIVIEDLTVRNMLKNHTLARAISDASWTGLRSMLEYKAQWYGRELIVVDRWYPSRQDLLVLRPPGREAAVDHPGMDLRRVRGDPRPGRERGEEHSGRRAGGVGLWSRCKTSTEIIREGDRR
jgi:IS605 OrfB family transposase